MMRKGSCGSGKGEAKVFLGGQAPDTRSEKLTGKKDSVLTIAIPNDIVVVE